MRYGRAMSAEGFGAGGKRKNREGSVIFEWFGAIARRPGKAAPGSGDGEQGAAGLIEVGEGDEQVEPCGVLLQSTPRPSERARPAASCASM